MSISFWLVLKAQNRPVMLGCAILVRMPIDQKILTKLLFLAHLDIDKEAQRSMLNKLSHTLEMIDRMHEAAAKDVAPLEHPLEQPLVLRQDQVTEIIDRDRLNATAPAMHEGSFLVPKVID